MNKERQEGTQIATEGIRQEITKGLDSINTVIREAKRVAIMNLVAASMVVVAAGIALFSILL